MTSACCAGRRQRGETVFNLTINVLLLLVCVAVLMHDLFVMGTVSHTVFMAVGVAAGVCLVYHDVRKLVRREEG
jgi:hypothetical protein